MKSKNYLKIHMAALFTITVWGVTYIFTKTLLAHFTPYQLLLVRFLLAWIILLLVDIRNFRHTSLKSEVTCFFLALTGVFFYFIFESFALTKTYAANVGLIMSAVPLFTGIISHFALKTERFTCDTAIGFVIAITGIGAILLNGAMLHLNLLGDVLALLAALSFAVYSVILRRFPLKLGSHIVVRKTFFYSALMLVPIVVIEGGMSSAQSALKWMITDYHGYVSILFLAIIASSICFYLWNRVVDILGAVRATGYIYLVPLISTLSAALFLHEKITPLMVIGGVMIVLGVYINERKPVVRFFSVTKEVF